MNDCKLTPWSVYVHRVWLCVGAQGERNMCVYVFVTWGRVCGGNSERICSEKRHMPAWHR